MSKKSYEKGKRWGFAIFKSNVELYGSRGLDKSDAAAQTCRRYATDSSIKRTKSGKVLDREKRAAYKGIYDGIYEAWEKAKRKQICINGVGCHRRGRIATAPWSSTGLLLFQISGKLYYLNSRSCTSIFPSSVSFK